MYRWFCSKHIPRDDVFDRLDFLDDATPMCPRFIHMFCHSIVPFAVGLRVLASEVRYVVRVFLVDRVGSVFSLLHLDANARRERWLNAGR